MRRSGSLAENIYEWPSVATESVIVPQYSRHTEIEFRFFMDARQLRPKLKLATLPFEAIFQAYFGKTHASMVSKVVYKRMPFLEMLDLHTYRSLRVRRVVAGDCLDPARGVSYFLQAKGAKTFNALREELSLHISQDLFDELLPLADDGSLEKLRFIDRGFILDRKGQCYKAEAHLDHMVNAGQSKKPRNLLVPTYENIKELFIDVEVPKVSLGPLLKNPNFHSFHYLEKALALESIPEKIRKKTKIRTLARLGLKHVKTQRALAFLRKIANVN